MSNKKLPEATHQKYDGPFFPPNFEKLQRAYETDRHRNHPVNEAFLLHYVDDNSIILPHMKFDPSFVTEDGTEWMTISFFIEPDVRYRVAFPKKEDPRHRNGMVSSHHVALYVLSEESIPEERLDKVAQIVYSLFEMTQRNYHP